MVIAWRSHPYLRINDVVYRNWRLAYESVPFTTSLLYWAVCSFFFFNDTATTEIYTLSLHDALPISVVNLAAQAGVRYSLINPDAYVDSNIVGFLNVLEGCRHHDVKHLVYASSSSVYGGNRSEEHTSELQSLTHLVCRLLLEKKENTSELHSLLQLLCPLPLKPR